MKTAHGFSQTVSGPFRFLLLIVLMNLFYWPASGQATSDSLMIIMEHELNREVKEFATTPQPPYFIAYRVDDENSLSIASSFGSLTHRQKERRKTMAVEVRVGNYEFDNTHPLVSFDDRDNLPNYGGRPVSLPLDNIPDPIQLMMWQQTQANYRSALAQFKAAKNGPGAASTNSLADFSKETPTVFVAERMPDLTSLVDLDKWSARIKRISASFQNNPDILDADADLEVTAVRKYYLSSEGTRIVQNRTFAYLTIRGSIRAEDGDIVPLHKSYFAFDPGKLPGDEVIQRDVADMLKTLMQLRIAPVAEPYTGPAILYAPAAGVFFHEIFGHRIEGHRLKDKNDGQTFKGKINEPVLPKSLSVVFDPTLSNFEGQDLNGYYQYDDQGVKAKRLKIVDAGVLKTFLMSRSPIENISASNGHGRAQAGMQVVSRQSNLLIENSRVVPMADLRKMLIDQCKKEKKPYGYLFKDVTGGFTTTDRFMPNAFNIFPTEVYRIYVDGRPDQLVRGVDLIGTPLAMFAEIQAADNQRAVFTGFCGAESGSVPVTAISPSLYVKRIETQKKSASQVEKYSIPRPTVNE